MKRAAHGQQKLIVDILSNAFNENQSVNYVVRQDSRRHQRIRMLMEYSYKVCQAFGEVWITDDNKACALLMFPERKRTTLRTIWWDIRLAFSVIGLNRVMKVLERETRIKAFHPSTPFCYLWFIGVDPSHQCNGIGSRLLKHIVGRCTGEQYPIYLETSTITNLPWYEKHGFEIFCSIELGYTLYLMRKG